MFFQGLLNLSAWGYFWAAMLLTHITIASVTIFLHRHQAHRALALHPAISHFFRFWLWLTTGMVTQEWAAVHRKHHAKCETEEDPHSPQFAGISKVLFGGALLYRDEAAKRATIDDYGHGTPDDWLERRLYSRHRFLGIGFMLLIDLLLFGAVGAVIWLVQMVWIPFWAAGVINGVGHYWGYRNFETADASRNIVPWGILIGGEELHNNHHAYGVSARLSNKWWEFDIGWLYIRLLEMLGLAKVKRIAPKTSFSGNRVVDMEMLRSIISNRFHILKLYGNRVVRPVIQAECQGVSSQVVRLLKSAQKIMTRENAAPAPLPTHQKLQQALNENGTLATIYDFKQRLIELWNQRAKDTELLARLQAWCNDAESSGIAALQEFALQLRGYRAQFA